MRSFLVFCLLLTAYAPYAQAQKGIKNWRMPQFFSLKATVLERRIIANTYIPKVEQVVRANLLNLPAVHLPALQAVTRNYYKTVALRFPNVAAKSVGEAKTALENLLLTLPASFKPENIFLERIPGIEKPTGAYLTAVLVTVWDEALEKGVDASKEDAATAQSLRQELADDFTRRYAALPAPQKDLRAQLSRVMREVQNKIGCYSKQIEAAEEKFALKLEPFIAKQDNLTALEFLQAYDVLAVAAEMPSEYVYRLHKREDLGVDFGNYVPRNGLPYNLRLDMPLVASKSILNVIRDMRYANLGVRGGGSFIVGRRIEFLKKWHENGFLNPNLQ